MEKDPSKILKKCVPALHALVAELRAAYPHRRFTLDGRLVGDIGEVIAEERYGLVPFANPSEKTHDGTAPDGRRVQVKATQADESVGISKNGVPDYLIVLRLYPDGTASEIYNGPGPPVCDVARGSRDEHHQKLIRVRRLRELNRDVKPTDRIPELN